MEGGTWGLVIILAAFMIQVLAFGATAAIGVYNIELLDYFPGATVEVSLIGSLNFGIFLGSGPIVSFLLTKFSYRKIALFGSCLVVIGILGMPLLPYIPAMCICFGVLAGFGSCCAYIPSHVLSGVYYDKYRSLATGVATSGSGLGGAIMPVLAGVLIDVYSWKGSLIIIAGLCLHLIVFSALLRSPPVYTSDTGVGPSKQASNKCLSQETQDETKALVTEGSERKHEEMIQEDEAHDFNGVDMNRLDFIDTASLKADHPSQENMIKKINRESFPNPSVNGESILQTKVDKDVSANESENVQLIHSAGNDLAKHLKHHSVSHSSLSSVGATRGSGYIVIDRDKNVHLSSVPEEKKDDTEAQNKMPSSSRHIFIFTNYGFDVYFLSNIMWNAGCSIITAFAPEFLREKGLTPMEAAWLSGAFGFGCFAGGLLGGLFGNFKWVNRQVLYTGANLVMGVILIMFPTFNHIGLYLACLIVSGIAFGVILGLLIVVLTDIIGIDSLGNGLGYLMLANGLGTFMGPPMAGLLKDKYGDFGAGIILSGILCLIGGFIMMLMPLKRFYRKGDKSVQSVNEKL